MNHSVPWDGSGVRLRLCMRDSLYMYLTIINSITNNPCWQCYLQPQCPDRANWDSRQPKRCRNNQLWACRRHWTVDMASRRDTCTSIPSTYMYAQNVLLWLRVTISMGLSMIAEAIPVSNCFAWFSFCLTSTYMCVRRMDAWPYQGLKLGAYADAAAWTYTSAHT